jgi:hypothetical protein
MRRTMVEQLLGILSARFWPNNDAERESFKRLVRFFFDAVNKYEQTRNLRNQNSVTFYRNNVFNLLVGHQQQQQHQAVLAFTFDQIYPSLAHSISNCVRKDLQKEHFLADLLTIPLDNIHGYLCENNIPAEAYSRKILETMLHRQENGQFDINAIDKIQCRDFLNEAENETTEAAFQRVYTYFNETARRYFGGQTRQLIQLLLDKKDRNKRVHLGKNCAQYYRVNPHADIYNFLSQSQYLLLDEAFGPRQNAPVETRQEVRNLEKMFKHYCKADVEEW